jgi:adenylate cyclase
MNKEIERKFLVRGEFRHLAKEQTKILQAYLSVDKEKTVRLRIAGARAYLSVKSGSKMNSLTRNEWEFPVSVSDAKEMLKICLPGKIEKTRYIVPSGRHKFEVDVFHDKNEGLIIAEIELSSENEQFDKPEWLGEEVSGKPEYYNAYLIK